MEAGMHEVLWVEMDSDETGILVWTFDPSSKAFVNKHISWDELHTIVEFRNQMMNQNDSGDQVQLINGFSGLTLQ